MPELPEIESYRYYIQKHCLHKIIKSIECTSHELIQKPSFPILRQKIEGKTFSSVLRNGVSYFSNNDSTKFKSSYLQAHRHSDHLCPKNHHHSLTKVTIAGRTAYYCSHDQK